jgi:hypothetical protein
MSANPVSEAIRLLREVAGLVEGEKGHAASCEFRDAASALAAYVAEPEQAEIERLVDVYWDAGQDDTGIRAVLRAIGGGQP